MVTGTSCVAFPLTPALSLGERESRIPSLGKPERIDRAEGLATILPLPEGEGRGVGKGDICHWRIFDGGTNSENCSWSKSFAVLIKLGP